MKPSKSIQMIGVVAKGLGDLNKQVAFVGGATIALYITDKAAPPIRATDDVDCVIEVASRAQYYKLERDLEERGFKKPSLHEEGPICRWDYCGIKVDVMPTQEKILGFQNRWYLEGLKHAVACKLSDGQMIRIFSLPYLLAAKVEAFLGRGKSDYIASSDMEDIVALADGALDFRRAVNDAPNGVKSYLSVHFKNFLASSNFTESLEGHAPGAGRAARIHALLQNLSSHK